MLSPAQAQEERQVLRDELLMTRDHLQTVIDRQRVGPRGVAGRVRRDPVDQRGVAEHQRGAGDRQGGAAVTNEEPTTVNEELQHRNQDLARAHDDLRNLLANIDIPILMLDRDLKIGRSPRAPPPSPRPSWGHRMAARRFQDVCRYPRPGRTWWPRPSAMNRLKKQQPGRDDETCNSVQVRPDKRRPTRASREPVVSFPGQIGTQKVGCQ